MTPIFSSALPRRRRPEPVTPRGRSILLSSGAWPCQCTLWRTSRTFSRNGATSAKEPIRGTRAGPKSYSATYPPLHPRTAPRHMAGVPGAPGCMPTPCSRSTPPSSAVASACFGKSQGHISPRGRHPWPRRCAGHDPGELGPLASSAQCSSSLRRSAYCTAGRAQILDTHKATIETLRDTTTLLGRPPWAHQAPLPLACGGRFSP